MNCMQNCNPCVVQIAYLA
uniref:Uncharacterized protein n=1 Tax=Anguilla anguilla TaxID=7936 RepID=A0A0E9VZQ1_ANGAN